jgi:Sulfotransferase domain
VGDVIATMTEARPMFEPFLSNTSGEFALLRSRQLIEKDLKRNYQLYIRPGEGDSSPHYQSIQAILHGRVRGPWCDNQASSTIYRRRLIKEIRLNLFLGYTLRTWPAVRVIWLIRNPFDVIDSMIAQARKGWSFDWNVADVLGQDRLLADWLSPFVPSMNSAMTLPERLAHKWCIETYVPLQQNLERHPNLISVSYEELKQKANGAWERIAEFLDCATWNSSTFEQLFKRPSRTSRDRMTQSSKSASGHFCLSVKDKERIQEIIEHYHLDHLYG